jgi:hypothetical protein
MEINNPTRFWTGICMLVAPIVLIILIGFGMLLYESASLDILAIIIGIAYFATAISFIWSGSKKSQHLR